MENTKSGLYLNDGSGHFATAATSAATDQTFPFLGDAGAGFVDFDLDGDLDARFPPPPPPPLSHWLAADCSRANTQARAVAVPPARGYSAASLTRAARAAGPVAATRPGRPVVKGNVRQCTVCRGFWPAAWQRGWYVCPLPGSHERRRRLLPRMPRRQGNRPIGAGCLRRPVYERNAAGI